MGSAASCSVCTSVAMQGFIGAERCGNSMNRRPGQVCVLCFPRGGTVSFAAVNNVAPAPLFCQRSSDGAGLEIRSPSIYIQDAARFPYVTRRAGRG